MVDIGQAGVRRVWLFGAARRIALPLVRGEAAGVTDLLNSLRQRYEGFRKRRAMQRIREHAAFFGYPMDDVSDEQMERGMERLAVSFREAGLSASQAADVLRQAGPLLVEAERAGGERLPE